MKNEKDEKYMKSTHERKYNARRLRSSPGSIKTEIKIFKKIYVAAPREILQNNVTTWECHVKVKVT